MDRSCSTHASMRNADKVLGGKPERSRPLGRPKCGWRDAIKIDFKQFGTVCTGYVCLRIRNNDEHV
jgi:hypothetical protein